MSYAFIVSVTFFLACYTQEVTSQEYDDVLSSTASEGVQEVIVPMCRGLVPYSHTKLPNSFGHSTQVEVNRIIEHMWAFMDAGCSRNFRLLVCSLYLPPYNNATGSTALPCRQTCMRARKMCKPLMKRSGLTWPSQMRCKLLPRKSADSTCVKPNSERRKKKKNAPMMYCERNPLPLCQGLPVELGYGTLPNRYLQREVPEIGTEMTYYTKMLNSQCSPHLNFFLCGTYMPFCVNPFNFASIPCKELCEEVKTDCEPFHTVAYQGLPWPNKLQCHRFPTIDSGYPCVMPEDYLDIELDDVFVN